MQNPLNKPHRILISGGGTGGHVFPAIAIANAIRQLVPDAEILFVGAMGRLEMDKVPAAGYRIVGLPVMGFPRKPSLKVFSFFIRLFRSMMIARKVVKDFNPHCVIGVGGYVSGPVLRVAARNNIPCLIQEQNSYAGVTNRLLSKKVDTICVAYEGMEKYFPAEKIVLTGNPVRREISERREDRSEACLFFDMDAAKPVVLVIGGSLGAGTINKAIIRHLDEIRSSNVQFIWQCGKYYYPEAEAAAGPHSANPRVLPFIERMDMAYAAADIIISRAGAISISELCIIGKPCIFVPSPNVAEDHQTRNAQALTAKDAALLVPDSDALEILIQTAIDLVKNKQQQEQLSSHIRKLGIPDASIRIANEVLKLIRKND